MRVDLLRCKTHHTSSPILVVSPGSCTGCKRSIAERSLLTAALPPTLSQKCSLPPAAADPWPDWLCAARDPVLMQSLGLSCWLASITTPDPPAANCPKLHPNYTAQLVVPTDYLATEHTQDTRGNPHNTDTHPTPRPPLLVLASSGVLVPVYSKIPRQQTFQHLHSKHPMSANIPSEQKGFFEEKTVFGLDWVFLKKRQG